MDYSSKYIKMCDCHEVQDILGQRERSYYGYWHSGDFRAEKNDGNTVKVYEEVADDEGYYYGKEDQDFIWLPRQDQLQAMVLDNYNTFQYLLHEFYNFSFTLVTTEGSTLYFKGTSMEQLWLGFVMKENHHKIWKNDKWVINNE